MSLVFDTLKLSKTLGRVFTPEQAEVLAEALSANLTESLATKPDLVVLQSKLEAKIDTKIDGLRAELKADLSNFRAETRRRSTPAPASSAGCPSTGRPAR